MKPTMLAQKLICLHYHVIDRKTQRERFTMNDVMTVPVRWSYGMILFRVNDIIDSFNESTPGRELRCDIIGG